MRGTEKMRVLDLFSGIGGMSLGLERTGQFETVAFCEIDPKARKILAKHWPAVPCFTDVRRLKGSDVGHIDVITGGFPCQDVSEAGHRIGIAGERSGLWSDIARLIGELRPSFAIVENVSGLLSRGLGVVLGDLAALGYDAEWHCIPASSVGAPQERDRIWILAYPQGSTKGSAVAIYCREQIEARRAHEASPTGGCLGMSGVEDWRSEPNICRVDDGISANVDRLALLGNSVLPQIPELIGRAILASTAATDAMERNG